MDVWMKWPNEKKWTGRILGFIHLSFFCTCITSRVFRNGERVIKICIDLWYTIYCTVLSEQDIRLVVQWHSGFSSVATGGTAANSPAKISPVQSPSCVCSAAPSRVHKLYYSCSQKVSGTSIGCSKLPVGVVDASGLFTYEWLQSVQQPLECRCRKWIDVFSCFTNLVCKKLNNSFPPQVCPVYCLPLTFLLTPEHTTLCLSRSCWVSASVWHPRRTSKPRAPSSCSPRLRRGSPSAGSDSHQRRVGSCFIRAHSQPAFIQIHRKRFTQTHPPLHTPSC